MRCWQVLFRIGLAVAFVLVIGLSTPTWIAAFLRNVAHVSLSQSFLPAVQAKVRNQMWGIGVRSVAAGDLADVVLPLPDELPDMYAHHLSGVESLLSLATQLESSDAWSWRVLAKVQALRGDIAEGERSLSHLESGHGNALISLERGDLFYALGRPQDALDAYARAEYASRQEQGLVCCLALMAADSERADEWLQRAYGIQPGNLYVLYQLYREAADPAYLDELRYFSLEAIAPKREPILNELDAQTMQALVSDGIWERDTLLNVISYRVWQDQSAATEALLNDLLEDTPRDTDLWFYLGELYHRQGDLDAAEEAYRRVIDIDPEYAQAYLRMGMICEERAAQVEDE